MTSQISLQADHEQILERLRSLGPDSQRQWGKMRLPQALAHCHRPLQVALGKLQLKRGLIGFLFGRYAKKKFIVSDAPFGHNSPTDPRFLDPSASDLEQERGTLVELIQEFARKGSKISAHPFFGPMDAKDWDRLMWKHLDHHLRQFGA